MGGPIAALRFGLEERDSNFAHNNSRGETKLAHHKKLISTGDASRLRKKHPLGAPQNPIFVYPGESQTVDSSSTPYGCFDKLFAGHFAAHAMNTTWLKTTYENILSAHAGNFYGAHATKAPMKNAAKTSKVMDIPKTPRGPGARGRSMPALCRGLAQTGHRNG